MAHPRQAIRDAIVTALDVGTLAGRVFGTRMRKTADDELPVALVYATQETSELANLDGALARQATLVVEARQKTAAPEDIGESIDDLCALIEASMKSDRSFGRLAMDSWLSSTNIFLDKDSEYRQAVARLEYQVMYRTG